MTILPIGLRGMFPASRSAAAAPPTPGARPGFGRDGWQPAGGSGDAMAALDRNGDGYLSGNEIPQALQAHAYRAADGRMILTRERLAQSGWTGGPPAPAPQPQPVGPAPQPWAPQPPPVSPAPQPWAPQPQPVGPAPQPWSPPPQPVGPAPSPFGPAPSPFGPPPQQPVGPAPQPWSPPPQPVGPAPQPWAPPQPQPQPVGPAPAPSPVGPAPAPTPAGPSFEALGLRSGANLTLAPGTRVKGFKIEGQAQMRQVSATTLVADAQISAAMGFVKKNVSLQCQINGDGTLTIKATEGGKSLMDDRLPILPSAPGTLSVQGPEGKVTLQGDGRGGLIADGPAGRLALSAR